jgi:hypothetical protein
VIVEGSMRCGTAAVLHVRDDERSLLREGAMSGERPCARVRLNVKTGVPCVNAYSNAQFKV